MLDKVVFLFCLACVNKLWNADNQKSSTIRQMRFYLEIWYQWTKYQLEWWHSNFSAIPRTASFKWVGFPQKLLNSAQIPCPPEAARKNLLCGLEFRLQHFRAEAKNSTNDDTTGIQINPWAFLPQKLTCCLWEKLPARPRVAVVRLVSFVPECSCCCWGSWCRWCWCWCWWWPVRVLHVVLLWLAALLLFGSVA